ncbi:hypothetical protein QFZ58_000994 [Streptomyces sp. B1I3]|nr:hypothetical protein [Streptomyces sp. B1I3]
MEKSDRTGDRTISIRCMTGSRERWTEALATYDHPQFGLPVAGDRAGAHQGARPGETPPTKSPRSDMC